MTSTRKKLGIGLIGVGRLGRVYARDLATRIPETRLVAAADPDPAARAWVAAEHEEAAGFAETDELLRGLMAIPANYKILYVHGGASLQFSALPLNLMGRVKKPRAHYFETGNFAARAIEEALATAHSH